MAAGTTSTTPEKPQGAGGRKSTKRRRATRSRAKPKPRRISRVRKPDQMSLEAWQVALRKQFGREQNYKLKNLGGEPIFSEFQVTNPETNTTYRVAVRGDGLGENYCSCPDFSVNTLGTCKHIEFTLAKLKRKRGGKTAFARGFQPEYSEIYLKYGAKRDIVFRPGAHCPQLLNRLADGYFDVTGVLHPKAYERFHVFLKKASAGKHEVRCYDDALAFISQVRDRAQLARRIDKAFPSGARSRAFAHLLKAPLYPYQREGALFAARAGRCLIADDMGLGKTVQAIAAVEILADAAGIERVLVISPTSLKHQWKQEIERFTRRTALIVEGLLPKRAQHYAADSFYKLTNYDVVFRDEKMIRRWQPDLIILDEAQRIKNWKTRTARSVKDLRSDYAFVLTGTPLENRLEELHSIVEFVDRFRLGPMFRYLSTHQHLDEHGKVVGYRNLSAISGTLEPILIRRTKQAVLRELPDRLEKRFFVPMTDQQWEHHEENREIVGRIVAKWRRYGYLSEIDQRRLTCALQNMRMSCNSTYLLDQKTDHGCKADELVSLLEEIFEDPGAKAVVFSQWLRMQELISGRLTVRKWNHVLFHGGVPGAKRKGLIEQFRQDPSCRAFLSTDAGGVGLNLQNASAVIIMDQPWNPAVLEQRIGRVHRLGQHRAVRVVHFIAKNTIEEGMLSLLAFKKSMFLGVLDGGKDEVFLGGTRLKRFMESVEQASEAIPTPATQDSQTPVGPDAAPSPAAATKRDQPETTAATASSQQLMADLVRVGAAFLDQLGKTLQQPGPARTEAGDRTSAGSLVHTDRATGQSYLKIPLPPQDTLQKIADMLAAFTSKR